MASEQFYLTLPSAGSLDVYPNNTLASYQINLSRTLNLNSNEWEVALSEIIVSSKVKNLPLHDRELKIVRYFPGKAMKAIGKYMAYPHQKVEFNTKEDAELQDVWETVVLPKGFYNNEEQVVDEWNIGFSSSKYCKDLRMQKTDQGLMVQSSYFPISYLNYNVQFFGTVFQKWYDLSEQHVETSHAYYYEDRIKDQEKNLTPPRIAYIYSNIAAHQFVGDKELQLLRIVDFPVDEKVGYGSITFHDLHYVNLLKSSIDTIKIDIKTITGENFPFNFGSLALKLHFRQKSARI